MTPIHIISHNTIQHHAISNNTIQYQTSNGWFSAHKCHPFPKAPLICQAGNGGFPISLICQATSVNINRKLLNSTGILHQKHQLLLFFVFQCKIERGKLTYDKHICIACCRCSSVPGWKKSHHLLFSIFLLHLMSYSSLELRPVTLIFNVGNILLKVKVIEDSGFLSMREIFRSLRVVSMVV